MEYTDKKLYNFKDRRFPDKICFKPIGLIHTEFKSLNNIPIQFSFSDSKGIIEIFPEFQTGLKDLDGFSHIYCIYFFDMIKQPVPLISKSFLDDDLRGVFSIRTPFRPNPIGLSILEVLNIINNKIFVNNVDILDQTPILDLKPYIDKLDKIKSIKQGWIEDKI